jgi:type IV pilus assembly protein PilA
MTVPSKTEINTYTTNRILQYLGSIRGGETLMKKTLTQGFTLIELLVVIAIIGILAAVVLVAINPAQRIAEANDSKVKSNIGQVATALEACYTANAGTYASGICDTTAHLATKGFLKQDLSSTVTVATTATFNNAIAYGVMTAASNSTGAVPCATGSSFMVYHTSTGVTDAKGGACTATAPTAP